jgi:hypothetical protein
MAEDLSSFLENQNIIINVIKRLITNYKKLPKANVTLIKTRAHLTDLQKHWEKVQSLDAKINLAATAEDEAADYLQEAISSFVAPESPAYDPDTAFTVGNEPQSSSLKLPRIPLLTFSGKISEWQKFRNTFHSLVHSNKTMTNIAKFYYLTSSVIGDAAATLDKFDSSFDNDNDAWEMLLNEYDDKRALICTNLQSFICLPKGKFETAVEFKKLRDTVNVALKNLSKLGCQVSSWDSIVVVNMTEKLGSQTLAK